MATKIEKILSVVDTRQYEEQGDRWVPIPGSGDLNACSRCGRMHEVHATVLLSDDSIAIVGTGCMKGENAELTSSVKKLTSASKRLAALHSEAAHLEALWSKLETVRAAVEMLELPEITWRDVEKEDRGHKYTQTITTMGDAEVWSFGTGTAQRRVDDVTRLWRNHRELERGITYKHYHARSALIALRRDIRKVEDKIAKLSGNI